MKELSIEQKAKAYDELFIKAKQIYNKENDVLIMHTIEDLFPEVKEPDGEKIRKALIEHFKFNVQQILYDFSNKDVLAWLEKQCKPKEYTFKSLPRLLDMIEPTSRAKAYCQKLIDILVKEGYTTDAKIVRECLKTMNGEDVSMAVMEKQGEQKPNPYTGVSFEYNGHIWGMCARDNGVDILLDKQLFKHLEKQGEQKDSYTTIVETGNGGINALVTRELSTDDVDKIVGMDLEDYL